MTTFKSLEEARTFFENDKFATGTGVKLEQLTDDKCICTLELTDNHKNGLGGVMGGVIFTLADFAFAVLSNHLHKPTVAQQVSINYLSTAKGNKLTATATYRKNGRNSSIVIVNVTDDTGRDIAIFTGVGFKLSN